MSKIILVPTDFTKVGATALNHALRVGKAIDADIHVLHVIGEKKMIAEARLKLNSLKAQIKEDRGENIETIVRIGNIFEDIDKVATEIGASLIIMGTHGRTGMQFITGGRALKIVTESCIPFVIVQERDISKTGYNKIIVPLDLHKETKQKLKIVASMAFYFDSEVHLVSPDETDQFLKNKLDRNINYAKTFLEEKGINYSVVIISSKSGSFVKNMLKYASSVDADLISIMNFYENGLMGIIGGHYEQTVITNEAQIPVLCINPMQTHIIQGSVFGQ